MKRLFAVAALVFAYFSATSLRADLLGTHVSGSLTFSGGSVNYFDPLRGFVPTGYGNSVSPTNVTVGSDIEFGFKDFNNRDSANFTATGLAVRDVCLADLHCSGSVPFQMRFTDLTFSSAALLTNDLGVTFDFRGNTLTINYLPSPVRDDNAVAIFSLETAAATPEPGTIALVGTGIVGATGAIRRRYLA